METEKLLQERGATHGDFGVNAAISQGIKDALRCGPQWQSLTPAQREAIDVIAAKLARIVTGDHNCLDHYRDIIGYTQLAMDATSKLPGATDVKVTKVKVNNYRIVAEVK